MKSERLSKLILILLGIGVGAISILLMPSMANIMTDRFVDFGFLKIPGLTIIYLSLIPFYLSIIEIWKLLDMVEKKDFFTYKAVESLNLIRAYAFSIFVIYLVILLLLLLLRVPFSSAYLTILVLDLASLAVGTLLTVLKKLLIVGLEMKKENDLTI